MGFCRVSAGFRRFRAGFSICGRFSKVFAGFLRFPADLFGRLAGFLFFPEILKPQASKAQCCAKSYIFAGTVSGAINGGNFATVLRGASTVIRISVANLDLNSTS